MSDDLDRLFREIADFRAMLVELYRRVEALETQRDTPDEPPSDITIDEIVVRS